MTKQNIETNKLGLKALIIIINFKFDVEKFIEKLLTLRNINGKIRKSLWCDTENGL